MGKGPRDKSARVVQGRQHVAVEAGVRRDRVARQREDRRLPPAEPKPERLARPLGHALEDLLNALPPELGGQEVELSLGDSARDQEDVVLGQDVPEHVLDLVAHVAHVEAVGLWIS